jgi:hypothetical protein
MPRRTNAHMVNNRPKEVTMETEVVCASAIRARVVERILDLRNPNRHRDFKRAKSAYRRALGKRKELIRASGGLRYLCGDEFFPATPANLEKVNADNSGMTTYSIGFNRLVNGVPEWVAQPHMAEPFTYHHSHGYKFGEDCYTPASDSGVLAASAVNRDIRHQRVDEYVAIMKAGEWRDLLSDPFAITADGQVVNGQHRMAACEDVEWETVGNDPAFLVIWNVDPVEALHADGSRRTPNDQTTIARKLATA